MYQKHINNKANGEVLDLKALPSARTFKVNANAILRLAEHLWSPPGRMLELPRISF